MHEKTSPKVGETPTSNQRERTELPANLEHFLKSFLPKLAADHPQFAHEIENKRLPNFMASMDILWKEFQESLTQPDHIQITVDGVDSKSEILSQEHPDQEFISLIMEGLNKLEYISNSEMVSIMTEYAAEVESFLSSNPSSIVVFESDYKAESSESYFAKMVYEMLAPQFKERVLFSGEFTKTSEEVLKGQKQIIVYRFDDSSNSGAQVISSTLSFIDEYTEYAKKIDFRVRLIASSKNLESYVKQKVEKWLQKFNITNASYDLNAKQKYLNTKIEVIYKGYSVTWGTSIVFAHKLQDNLPNLFISLSESHRRDKPHIFEYDVDIKPPYKKHL